MHGSLLMTFLYIFLEYFSYLFKCKKSLPTKLSWVMYNHRKHIFLKTNCGLFHLVCPFILCTIQHTLLVITIKTSWRLFYLGLLKHGFYIMWSKCTSCHDAVTIARRTNCIKVVYIYYTTQVGLVFSLRFFRV